jgi:aminoglycoside phosphotransferase (APT) family kinase protein
MRNGSWCSWDGHFGPSRTSPPPPAAGLAGDAGVIVHGDFGPQNMLFDLTRGEVVAVFAWEWAHLGERLKDLAWAELIVRMYHPESRLATSALLDASGLAGTSWEQRHQAMLRRCRDLLDESRSSGAAAAAVEWRRRRDATSKWTELA